MTPRVDVGAAASFIWRNARVLERHVFAALFLGGDKMRAVERCARTRTRTVALATGSSGSPGAGESACANGVRLQDARSSWRFRTNDDRTSVWLFADHHNQRW